MKSAHKVISPLAEENSARILPSKGAKKSPVSSKGGRLTAQPVPPVQNDAAASKKNLPDTWTEAILDPTLWAELRDIILGSNEDED